mmetsp:Transcript_14252/g.33954  ORF Transcript_14252/g.33954 Transcript_14252/m.33954 type:complete len:207 (-) Transcript_14252:111-731(-)
MTAAQQRKNVGRSVDRSIGGWAAGLSPAPFLPRHAAVQPSGMIHIRAHHITATTRQQTKDARPRNRPDSECVRVSYLAACLEYIAVSENEQSVNQWGERTEAKGPDRENGVRAVGEKTRLTHHAGTHVYHQQPFVSSTERGRVSEKRPAHAINVHTPCLTCRHVRGGEHNTRLSVWVTDTYIHACVWLKKQSPTRVPLQRKQQNRR